MAKIKKEQMDKKTWKETLKKFSKLPPPTIEKVDQCYHEQITKIIKDDFTYACNECGCIIDVYGSAMYSPEQYILKTLTIDLFLKGNNEYNERMQAMLATFMEELEKEEGK